MSLAERTALVDRVVDRRYRVVRHLADGGMGSVYLAVDQRLDREVALKVMRDELTRDARFVERFRKEARSAARLSHAHVVAVHDQGEDDGLVFLTMEYVEGRTLREVLREVGALTPREALSVVADVLEALAVAHRAGIIHRDVKPENVLIGDDGVVKVVDFGLARAVTTSSTALSGTVLGTVAYLAPEQVERGIADARSDVYATGLMLFEMLTGTPAVEGESAIHVAYQHVHGILPRPSQRAPGLPRAVDELIASATHRDPDRRPTDAGVFLGEVLACRARLTPAQLDARPQVSGREERPTTAQAPIDPDAETGLIAHRTRVLPGGTDDLPPAGTGGARTAATRSPRRHLLVPVLVFVVLLAGAATFVLLGPAAARAVPAVGGLNQAAAVQTVEDAGLRAEVTEEFSETVPAGTVIDTDPPAQTEQRRWSSVTLRVSRGPERYTVPDVTGQDPEAAAEALRSARLGVGATTPVYDEQVPTGRVARTDPAAGASLRPGTPVTLAVSRGREPIPLTDWTGKPLAEAKAALEPKDITVNVTEERFDADVPEGAIIAQNPEPTTLHRGDAVSFVVSKGPDLVTVPDVARQSEEQARAALEAAGFEVRVSRYLGGILGVAQSTDPAAGQRATRGSTVTLHIV